MPVAAAGHARALPSSLNRRHWLAAAALGLVPPALAQAEVGRILVGFGAGGSADVVARLLAQQMAALDGGGRRFLVENRPGGAGKIAVDALRAAPADGQTLLLAPLVTPVLSQLVFRDPGYDPGRDFAPVGLVGHFQFVLAVPAQHPARTLPEFLAWLRAHPAQANYGSPSAGSLPHFFGLVLGESVGVDFVHVAYKGGAPMLTDLAGGQISAGIDTEIELLPLHRSGKIRILGVFAPHRLAALPEVPTLVELGYPRASGSGWFSLWARQGTPAAAIASWNRSLHAALALPQVQRQFAEWGLEIDPRTPEQLEQLRVDTIARWRPVVEASGFRAD